MKDEIKTIDNIQELDCRIKDYNYQNLFTPDLDDLNGEFDQTIINQIVLWKVNRYAQITPTTLSLINQIKKEDQVLNEKLTREILFNLLGTDQKGVRLAMASTILRFKNPNLYQIIDQRVYRFIFGKELKYSLSNIEEQIDIYFEYLDKLKKVCKQKNIDFSEADRILYMMDKKWNTNYKLKY